MKPRQLEHAVLIVVVAFDELELNSTSKYGEEDSGPSKAPLCPPGLHYTNYEKFELEVSIRNAVS